MKHKRIKKSFFIITLLLILFFEIIIFINYNHQSIYLNRIAKAKVNEKLKKLLSKNIYQIIANDDLKLINTDLDKDGNIVYVDYDLKKTYKIIEKITDQLNKSVDKLENTSIKIPYYVNQNLLFYNLSPKVTVNIAAFSSIIINVESKVTNYGLNNAMVNLYLVINADYDILSGIKKDSNSYKYNMLISSYLITGKVPSFYGNSISTSGELFSVPIK